MSGKIIKFQPTDIIFPRSQSAVDIFDACQKLTLALARVRQTKVIDFLRYQAGASELAQDMKCLVIRRLACEALSQADLQTQEVLLNLLNAFPRPPLMDQCMIPQERQLGEASRIIETCQPAPNDNRMITRAKREGLLFNLTLLIQENFVLTSGVLNSRFRAADFRRQFSWIWEILETSAPPSDKEMRALIDVHVMKPPLPFNICLPEK